MIRNYEEERRERMRRYESQRELRGRGGRKRRGGGGGSSERRGEEEYIYDREITTSASSRKRPSSSGNSPGDVGETFAWKGAPPTVVELQNRLDSDEEDIMDNDYIETSASFFPGKEEFKDLLIEESKARIEVTGDWLKPLVQTEAKWRYGLYKAFLSFVDTDIGDGFDVESLMDENGQSPENR